LTIKELSIELGVSEQALRQWCKKNNVRKESTKARKASYIIDCDTEILIRNHYKPEKSNETNESKETKAGKQGKESNGNLQESTQQDLQKALIQSLQQQVEDLKADKKSLQADKDYLQERLTAAEQEREALTKERQTILAELLELRQPKEIVLKAPAEPEPAAATKQPAPRPRSERQQPKKKSSILENLKSRFFKKQ
jgi:hypothetical protein